MSGANSYVQAFNSLQEAKDEMYDTIRSCLSRCEPGTMDKFIELLKGAESEDNTIEETVDTFTIAFTSTQYEIRDNYDEDRYFFAILDTDNDERYSQF
jgi:hypothetical protein